MKKTTKKTTNKKTTAAAEKAAREQRVAARKSPRKPSEVIQEMAATPAVESAPVASSPDTEKFRQLSREAEVAQAREELGVELADNEFLSRPENLPKGAKVGRIVSRNGKELARPIFQVNLPAPTVAASETGSSKRSSKSGTTRDVTKPADSWTKGNVSGERAQAVLAKLKKGTREKPVLAAKQLSDQERALARRLFAQGQIQRDKFDEGIGYFA